ncbi:hypothetical protein ARMGADRAFT_1079024 [Armillaria gallica]|uniref:Uncharacterized protein n=1 Tax=Armillaria gallica TaxID=47427 RepID=A0A2H3E3T0_ARMGA|nr:hypothetical protein ARMGADRAFT_1079024 [Armillaria gallica]
MTSKSVHAPPCLLYYRPRNTGRQLVVLAVLHSTASSARIPPMLGCCQAKGSNVPYTIARLAIHLQSDSGGRRRRYPGRDAVENVPCDDGGRKEKSEEAPRLEFPIASPISFFDLNDDDDDDDDETSDWTILDDSYAATTTANDSEFAT